MAETKPCLREKWEETSSLANRHLSACMYKDAIEEYKKFIEFARSIDQCNPYVSLAYNNLGHIHYLQVNFDEAVLNYNLALQYSPNQMTAYFNRGTVRYRLGSFQEAKSDFKMALDLDNTFQPAIDALQACEKAIKSNRLN